MTDPYEPRHGTGTKRVKELLIVLAVGTVVGIVGVALLATLLGNLLDIGTGLAFAALVGLGLLIALLLVAWAGLRWRGEPWQKLADEGRGGTPGEVITADGATLHVEQDGPADARLTVVFCHDLFANLTVWREQRRMLAGSRFGLVFFDQRGHGMSTGTLDESMPGARQLARDLTAVLEAAAPQGRVVLVGHGAGAMGIMALAAEAPEVFRERVASTVLLATTAGPLRKSLTLGVPRLFGPVRPLVRRYAAAWLLLLGRLPRRLTRIAGMTPWLLGARWFGVHRSASRQVVRTAAAMAYDVPLGTAGAFLSAALEHDEAAATAQFSVLPTITVIAGHDRFVPERDQMALRGLLPGAKHLRVPDSGHLLPLEHPEVVTEQIRAMIKRAWADADQSGVMVGRSEATADVPPSSTPSSGLLVGPTLEDTHLLQKRSESS